jgi:hypothetical protein
VTPPLPDDTQNMKKMRPLPAWGGRFFMGLYQAGGTALAVPDQPTRISPPAAVSVAISSPVRFRSSQTHV